MIDKRLNYGRHLIQRFLIKSAPFSKVLDLGAGHGDDLQMAKKVQPGAELLAIENFEGSVKELKDMGIAVYETNLETDRLPFNDQSVDVIICNQILEHCKEIWWIFHEISRVLKKNGKLIIGVPNLASLHNRFLLLLGEQPTSIKNNTAHLRGYTKGDLLKLLNSGFPQGYFLIDFGGSNYYPFPAAIAKPLATILPNSSWGIFLMLEKRKDYDRGFLEYPLNEKLETNFFLGPKNG